MPTVNRTTSGIQNVSAASLQSLITTIKGKIVLNQSITAADVNQLIILYNTWIQHNHTSGDLRGIDTFGNITVYGGGTWGAAKTSSAALTTGGAAYTNEPFLNAIDDQIDAADVNTFISRINSIRTHKHTINDETG